MRPYISKNIRKEDLYEIHGFSRDYLENGYEDHITKYENDEYYLLEEEYENILWLRYDKSMIRERNLRILLGEESIRFTLNGVKY